MGDYEYIQPTFSLFNGALVFNVATMLQIVITGAIVFLICYLGARGARKAGLGRPSRMQNAMEWLVEFIRGLVASTMEPKRGNRFVMLAITLIMFIFVANFISVPLKFEMSSSVTGEKITWFDSPTADPHITLTLAVAMVAMTHLFGIRMTGAKSYFAHYFKPNPLMFPLHVIEEFAKALTLGLRLFGNIFAKGTLSVMIASAPFGMSTVLGGILVGAAMFVPMMAWQAFGIFMGAIQAFIFTILTLVYMAQKVEPDH